MNNRWSFASLVDGLKLGQRKVLYTCLKRNLVNKEIVPQLAESVVELSAYHHGKSSLMDTIVNMAQNFVGSNNLNLLQPIGQFGTRLHGGKGAFRLIDMSTMLSPLARQLFNVNDDPLLNFLYDDNLRIEPEWYCPIIPMVLVNGSTGITGYGTNIPNFDIREIVANLKRMLGGEEPIKMIPSYKNFKGTVLEVTDNKYMVKGKVSVIDEGSIEITELPIGVWTQVYKNEVMETMLKGTDKCQPMIQEYWEFNTETEVKFVVKMTPEKLASAKDKGLHEVFKLQTSLTTNPMMLFDENGSLILYNSVKDILQDFFDLRVKMYKKRKNYLEGMLVAECLKLDNIGRFIKEKIEGIIVIENKKKKDLIDNLVRRGYNSDPVKAYKEAQNKGKMLEDDLENEYNEDAGGDQDFNYILGMPLWSIILERIDELIAERDDKAEELKQLRNKSPLDLWINDLDLFLEELDKVEHEKLDPKILNKQNVGKTGQAQPVKKMLEDSLPSPVGRRIEPRVDSAIKEKAEKAAIKKLKADDNIRKMDKVDQQLNQEKVKYFKSLPKRTSRPQVQKPKTTLQQKPKTTLQQKPQWRF